MLKLKIFVSKLDEWRPVMQSGITTIHIIMQLYHFTLKIL